MAFPELLSTGLIIFGTGVWASSAIIETTSVGISFRLANISRWSQSDFQDAMTVLYGFLLMLSVSAFFSASYMMGLKLYNVETLQSSYNLATLGVTIGTGWWALGSMIATLQNQFAILFAGIRATSNPQGVWQSRVGSVVRICVGLGVLFFALSLFTVGKTALDGGSL